VCDVLSIFKQQFPEKTSQRSLVWSDEPHRRLVEDGRQKKGRYSKLDESYAVVSCWMTFQDTFSAAKMETHTESVRSTKSEHRSGHPIESGITDWAPWLGVFFWIEITIPLNRDTCHVHFMPAIEIYREMLLKEPRECTSDTSCFLPPNKVKHEVM
jgi:hypothetical protein